MDIVSPWFTGERLDLVCLCVCVCLSVQHHAQHQVCVESAPPPAFPLLSRTLDYPECLTPWQPGGLLSLPSCTQGEWERERGEREGEREGGKEEKRGQSRDYECACVYGSKCASALNVCLCSKRRSGGGKKKKKIYLTCWQSSIFQIQQQEKNERKTTHQDISLPQNQQHPPSTENRANTWNNTSSSGTDRLSW